MEAYLNTDVLGGVCKGSTKEAGPGYITYLVGWQCLVMGRFLVNLRKDNQTYGTWENSIDTNRISGYCVCLSLTFNALIQATAHKSPMQGTIPGVQYQHNDSMDLC